MTRPFGNRRPRRSFVPLRLLFLFLAFAVTSLRAQDRFLSTGGPYGGPVAQLLAGGPGEFIAIASGFQLYRTSNGGADWRPLAIGGAGELPPTVQLVAFDSAGVLYAAGAGEIWSSTDRGANWSARSNAYPGEAPDSDRQSRHLQCDRDGTIYHVIEYRRPGRFALYRKSPGAEWVEITFPEPGENRFRSLTLSGDGVLLIGGVGGVWRSTTQGRSWTLVRQSFGAGDSVSAIAVGRNGRIWARTEPESRFHFSEDHGATWAELPHTGLPPNTALTGIASGRGENLIAVSMSGAFRSTDGGRSWSTIGSDPTRPDGFTPPRIAIDNATGDMLVALGDLYRSTDDGATWTIRNHGLAGSMTISLVEGRDGVILCGTPGRIYRSRDRGASWEQAGSGLPGGGLVYVLEAAKDGTLFASIYGQGLYRSTDNGTTWSAANQGLETNRVTGILTGAAGGIYLSTMGGVYRSIDGGGTWQSSSTGIPVNRIEAITEGPGGTLFVAAYGAGVYASSDSGSTWIDRSVGLADPRLTSVYASPSGMLLVGSEINGIYRSADSGRRWTAVTEGGGSRGARIARGWATDRNGVHYVGTDGGVLRSTDDGLSWRGGLFPYLLGNTAGQPASLSIIATSRGDILATSLGGGVLKLVSDSAQTWERVTDGPSGPVRRLWAHDLYLSGIHPVFAATSESMMRHGFIGEEATRWQRLDSGLVESAIDAFVYDPRSNDMLVATAAGIYRQNVFALPPRSWRRSSQGLPPARITTLAASPVGGMIFAGTTAGVYRSSDGGSSWASSGGAGAAGVQALLVTGSGRLIVAHELGVFRTDDNGEQWQSARNGLPFAGVRAFARYGRSTLYAGTDGFGLYRSTDDGFSWHPTVGSLPNQTVNTVAVTPAGVIHVGTERGCFRSSDGGVSWRGTIPFTGRINSILVANDGRVWIATEGGGLFRSSVERGISSVGERALPRASNPYTLRVEANGDRVVVGYPGSEERPGLVSIYDISGREITRADGTVVGASEIALETGGLASGIYFVLLETTRGPVSIGFAIRR